MVVRLCQDFFVAKPSHRFAYMCLDNVKCIRIRFYTELTCVFQNSYVETFSSATRTMISIQIHRVSF